MTPAGTSNKLDVQNEWEENTHTHCTIDSPADIRLSNPILACRIDQLAQFFLALLTSTPQEIGNVQFRGVDPFGGCTTPCGPAAGVFTLCLIWRVDVLIFRLMTGCRSMEQSTVVRDGYSISGPFGNNVGYI